MFMSRYGTIVPPPEAPRGVVVSDVGSTSVQVSWQAVEDADRYTVTFTETMGDDQLGLCSETHTVSVDTPSLSVVVGQTGDDMLRAYTTYSITVVAVSDVRHSSEDSEPIAFNTPQTSRFGSKLLSHQVNCRLLFFPLQMLQYLLAMSLLQLRVLLSSLSSGMA